MCVRIGHRDCRDEKDQVFLVLAHVTKANALVTGDADILTMREAFPVMSVTPDQLAERQAVHGERR
ncbi:MAG: putative toxin-antitoxin system toxin component, PIN family [Burkholderiaceae bacterium]